MIFFQFHLSSIILAADEIIILFQSLQRLARDIYFKYIDSNSRFALDGLR